MFAVPALLLAFYAAADPAEVLRRTAETYANLQSFELSASLTVKVPGQDLLITTHQGEIYATGAMLPADAPVPLLVIGTSGGAPEFRGGAGEQIKARVDGFGIASFPFSLLDVVDRRVITVRGLPDESLQIGPDSSSCTVIEVLYERRTPFDGMSGRPVRLWIEKGTFLVRQAVYEREWHRGELAKWTARVDKMVLNQPPPAWALEKSEIARGREEPKWVGQPAPGFSMRTLGGRTISLAALRGKVVVLNFWATCCGPCREEMPLLESLRDEMKSQGVEIWGVTNESPETARRWLADWKRSLPTLIDADGALVRQFAIESIPVLIVIRPDGKISTFVVGLRGARDLRADIMNAMK